MDLNFEAAQNLFASMGEDGLVLCQNVLKVKSLFVHIDSAEYKQIYKPGEKVNS